jgi:hypothetical protein
MACTRVIVTPAIRYRTRALRCKENSAYLGADFERADERTRTADLPSLRVCGQGLLRVAGSTIGHGLPSGTSGQR